MPLSENNHRDIMNIYLMEVNAYPLLSFMRALWPQVIARAVVGAVFATVAASRRRVPSVCLWCYRGGYAGVTIVWLRLIALNGDLPTLIAILFTVVLRTLEADSQCALLLLPLLLLLLQLQQWSLVSPT